jgi:hypothetical protein
MRMCSITGTVIDSKVVDPELFIPEPDTVFRTVPDLVPFLP